MSLVFLIVAALVLGLGLVQAWTIWFLKREVQRLEFRLNESLDDEDLLEFQERLRGLLNQAKETADDLADRVDRRREAIEKALERAQHMEKNLALRVIAKTAAEMGKDTQAPQPGPKAVAKAARALSPDTPEKIKPAAGARAEAKPPTKPWPKAPPAARAADRAAALEQDEEKEDGPAAKGREARRTYLGRPQAPLAARHQKIYDLADQGLDVEQIARKSGLLAGEVDLILNLRRKQAPGA